MDAGIMLVAAVSESAKLSTMPVFLKVFITPEPTPYLPGGAADIIALVFAGQNSPPPIPKKVSARAMSSRGVVVVSRLRSKRTAAWIARPDDATILEPTRSDRIPANGPVTAVAIATGTKR